MGSLPIPRIDLPRVIGHRGAAGHAPENTLASLRKAADLGVAWVEVDVALAGGGIPILMHDDTLDRTTSGTGPVAVCRHADLSSLDAGGWFDARFRGERVPGFADALRLCDDLDLGVDVEVKPTPGTDRETTAAVIATLKRVWSATGGSPQAFISSFSRDCIAVARSLAPDVPRGLLVWAGEDDWSEARELGCFSVLANHAIVTDGWARSVRAAGFALGCYTVNRPGRAADLRAIGVDCIISDWPDRVA